MRITDEYVWVYDTLNISPVMNIAFTWPKSHGN